jgi:hypothetical protein
VQGHRRFLDSNIPGEVPFAHSFVPVGLLISSAGDVAKYLSAQLPGSAHAARLGISAPLIDEWHRGVAAMDPDGKCRYAMGWAADTFNGLPVVYHSGDTGVFASEFTLDLVHRRGVVLLANGSHWLTSPYVHEISSGIVNTLAGAAPRDDTFIHNMAFAILAIVLAIPLVQVFTLVLGYLWRRPRSVAGRAAMIVLHGAAALGLLYFLPRGLYGIPLTELVISVPDMGLAARVSGAAALFAVLAALRRPRAL